MRTAWARRQRKMKRKPNTWLKGKCLAISNSSVNSENFKLFMTQSYTGKWYFLYIVIGNLNAHLPKYWPKYDLYLVYVRCCEQLLVGRKKQPISDQAEDLECLCHLMKTCGRILDTPKGKLRMDQYIERLEHTIGNPQMPQRIRFMLQVHNIIQMKRQ